MLNQHADVWNASPQNLPPGRLGHAADSKGDCILDDCMSAAPLTGQEIDLLNERIRQCWYLPSATLICGISLQHPKGEEPKLCRTSISRSVVCAHVMAELVGKGRSALDLGVFMIRNTRWSRMLLDLLAHRARTSHSSQVCPALCWLHFPERRPPESCSKHSWHPPSLIVLFQGHTIVCLTCVLMLRLGLRFFPILPSG